jgi:thymidylate synthase (FAD)
MKYFQILRAGCTPQIARSVLPNCLKTEIVMMANLREWRHFIKLRGSNCLKTEIVMMANLREWRHFIKLRGSAAAHPQIRPVAYGIWNVLKDYAPNVFSDLSPLSILAPPVVE